MKVVVLLGGPSAEREISLATGRAVVNALRNLGHQVSTIDPVLVGDAAPGMAPGLDGRGPGAPGRDGARRGPAPGYLGFLSTPEFAGCEVVFIALHGEVGEDGKIQATLDLAGVPYTGSGALASALSMNKDLSKKIFVSQGIPTPEWVLYSTPAGSSSERPVQAGLRPGPGGQGPEATGSARDAVWQKTDPRDPGKIGPGPSDLSSIGGFPVVVKPNDQGSTIGLSIVEDEAGMPAALKEAARYSEEIVVERYIPGRELTVSVLGSQALPVVEIIPEGGLYDYARKYTKGASRYVVPAELEGDLERRVRELGLKCFNALGCRGFGRVDMRLSPENEVFCLEVNTVPGMTETSLVPMAAEAVGISFDQMVERILASASMNGPHKRGEK